MPSKFRVASLAVVAALAWPVASRAEATTPAPAAATQPTTEEQTSYAAPNRWILGGGILGFVGSYAPAVAVALANSSSFNNQLYIPVAGPWLDLAKRPSCGTGLGQTSCVTEDAYQVLLVIDGMVQALSVVAIGVGAVVPEKRTRRVIAKAPSPRVMFTPTISPTSYGGAVVGSF